MASDDDDHGGQQPTTTAGSKTEFQNKLEEQARSKGGLSYTYFAAGASGPSGAAAAAAPPAAVPITAAEAAALEEAAKANGGGSAWNAAGTYEERDVSAWARSRAEALLADDEPSTPCGAVRVASAACTGEAHVVFVRGKRRAAFELAVTICWRAASNPEVQGTAKTREAVTGDDIDDEADVDLAVALDAAAGGGGGVKDGGDAAAAAAAAAVRAAREGLRGVLCERLRRLRQEMRDGQAGGGAAP